MNEQTLTLYYYNDGLSKAERQAVTDALAADAELAERYRRLSAELSGIADAPAEPLPGDLLARLHDTIDRAAMRETPRTPERPVHFWSFFWGAAVTAALALGIGIGVWFAGSPNAPPATTVVASEHSSAPLVRGLRVHLADSRAGLDSLPNYSDEERMLLILSLIDQNRLYARAAEEQAPELARVLRAFERVLVRLAADDISPQDAALLREQLAFEFDVMLTKLARESSEQTDRT